jgi:hypothetical protein
MAIEYEKEPCGRCGGSGHYSYNQINGTRCFGCGGSGERLTKRGRAAREFATSILEVPIEAYHEKHQGQMAAYRDAMTGGKSRFNRSEETAPGAWAIKDGERIPIRCFSLLRDGKELPVAISQGIRVRLYLTPETEAEVTAYASTLTKAGKVRKGTKS